MDSIKIRVCVKNVYKSDISYFDYLTFPHHKFSSSCWEPVKRASSEMLFYKTLQIQKFMIRSALRPTRCNNVHFPLRHKAGRLQRRKMNMLSMVPPDILLSPDSRTLHARPPALIQFPQLNIISSCLRWPSQHYLVSSAPHGHLRPRLTLPSPEPHCSSAPHCITRQFQFSRTALPGWCRGFRRFFSPSRPPHLNLPSP